MLKLPFAKTWEAVVYDKTDLFVAMSDPLTTLAAAQEIGEAMLRDDGAYAVIFESVPIYTITLTPRLQEVL